MQFLVLHVGLVFFVAFSYFNSRNRRCCRLIGEGLRELGQPLLLSAGVFGSKGAKSFLWTSNKKVACFWGRKNGLLTGLAIKID